MAMPDLPIPAELALDAEPLTDADLARYFDEAEALAADAAVDLEYALAQIAMADDGDPNVRAVARWRIEDDEAAEWAMRKLALANAEQEQLRLQAEEWMARIQHWFTQASRQHVRTSAYMEDRLADYGARRREAGGGATLQLPSGTVKTTSSKPAVEVSDDNVLADYVRDVLASTDAERTNTWRAALLDAEVAEDDLVKRTPKVYVGPLRQLVRAAEVQTGDYRLRVVFDCGHTIDSVVASEDTLDRPSRGEVLPCGQCASPQPVVTTITSARTEWVVLGPDGREVPGAQVRPGGISVKVSAQ